LSFPALFRNQSSFTAPYQGFLILKGDFLSAGTGKVSNRAENFITFFKGNKPEKLARMLARYDVDYRSQQRQEGWPEYYASQLLEGNHIAG